MQFLHKAGELVLVNIAFVVCSLPLVTLGSALCSLYYAVIKSIRRERGNPLQQFFQSMRRTLAQGCAATLIFAAAFALLYGVSQSQAAAGNRHVLAALIGLAAALICVMVNFFPAMSRFSLPLPRLFKLSFVMGIRFFPNTLLVAAGTAVVVWLLFFLLPVPCVLIVPGVWCFAVTYLMEKPLRAYMPKPKPGEDAWYYEEKKT